VGRALIARSAAEAKVLHWHPRAQGIDALQAACGSLANRHCTVDDFIVAGRTRTSTAAPIGRGV